MGSSSSFLLRLSLGIEGHPGADQQKEASKEGREKEMFMASMGLACIETQAMPKDTS